MPAPPGPDHLPNDQDVTGIMSVARMIPTKSVDWRKIMTQGDYDRVFGPQTRFEPDGIHELYPVLYGGLINTPKDAVDYAFVLMQTKPALARIVKTDLSATEHGKVWHITSKASGGQELLSLSRSDGRVLSGD